MVVWYRTVSASTVRSLDTRTCQSVLIPLLRCEVQARILLVLITRTSMIVSKQDQLFYDTRTPGNYSHRHLHHHHQHHHHHHDEGWN